LNRAEAAHAGIVPYYAAGEGGLNKAANEGGFDPDIAARVLFHELRAFGTMGIVLVQGIPAKCNANALQQQT
jgi:hypothetical protein